MSMSENALEDGYPFTELYRQRVRENQDLVTIVSDRQNRRGTGKTVFSLKLAAQLDRTEEGITTEKVAIDPEELTEAYVELPKGSALVLDEAEAGLSKYEAGTAVNKAIRQLVSMGRVREKYLILNLPASSELDRDLKALCDFWVMVQEKGRALGHLLSWNPYSEEPRTPKTEEWEWTDIEANTQLREVYEYLHEEKMAHLRGERSNSAQKLSQAEAREMVAKAREEAETETRNQLLTTFYQNTDLTQKAVAEAAGLSRSRVADIVSS
jgi:DNA-directed RNA polymerase specialized sigma subunit